MGARSPRRRELALSTHAPAPNASIRQYGIFYFCFYAALGAYTPYITRFIDHLGFSGLVAGTMLGLWYATRIIAPPLWALALSQSPRPGRWMLLGCGMATLGFAGFGWATSVPHLLASMLLFGLFYNAVMPQFEAMTLTALAGRTEHYGRLRVWGSVGFLIVAGTYGALFDRYGERWFVYATLPWLALMLLAAWPHRRAPAPSAGDGRRALPLRNLWSRPGVRPLLFLALLCQAGFGAFYVFFTLHMQAHGHSGMLVGLLWSVGVLVEIVLFWQAPTLIRRFGVNPLMTACLAVTILRWLITALVPESIGLMLLAQASHALGFALFHACLMQRMAALFPGTDAGAGQGLLYGFSSGLGGVVGALLVALLWEWRGGEAAFIGAAVIATMALTLHLGSERRRVPAKTTQSP